MDENVLCTKTHEYVLEKDGNYEIGITDYAIEQLGDIVFVELPETGAEFTKNEVFAFVEDYILNRVPERVHKAHR